MMDSKATEICWQERQQNPPAHQIAISFGTDSSSKEEQQMEVSTRAEHILNTRTGTLQSRFFQLDSGSAAALLVDGSRQMEVSNLGAPGAVWTHTGLFL